MNKAVVFGFLAAALTFVVSGVTNGYASPGGQAGIIADLAIQNPTSTTNFPSTSTIVIGVDEIAPGAEMAAGANVTTTK